MSEIELKARIIAILAGHTREMEGYSYFGSNPGIPEDEYEEIADEVIALIAADLPRDDSPMAKMAAALRGKAEAERAEFDRRVNSGEWGPMPENPDVLELPALPEEVDSVRCMIRGEKDFAEACDYYYTAGQMREYARAALAQASSKWQPLPAPPEVEG